MTYVGEAFHASHSCDPPTPQFPPREEYLLIDEFQRVAAHLVDTILQIARGMNIGVILANQSMPDSARGEIQSQV